MKSTLELSTFLFIKYKQYCKQMGFTKSKYPMVVTNIKDLPGKSLKISVSATMRHDGECLGLHYPSTDRNKPDLIYIDIQRHSNKKQLLNTLIHELCHARFETTIHDTDFYKKIKDIKNGKRF